jgi:hypothetical protein
MTLLLGLPESIEVDESGVFLCQYHSTMVLNAHISPEGEEYAQWWPKFRDIVSPNRHDQSIKPLVFHIS